MENELKVIKKAILEVDKKHGIEIEKIILFGSRARGEGRENSDWDLLIVTKEKLDWKTERKFFSDVGWNLVNHGIVPEIIIVDSKTFAEKKAFSGYVYYHAEKEGIVIA